MEIRAYACSLKPGVSLGCHSPQITMILHQSRIRTLIKGMTLCRGHSGRCAGPKAHHAGPHSASHICTLLPRWNALSLRYLHNSLLHFTQVSNEISSMEGARPSSHLVPFYLSDFCSFLYLFHLLHYSFICLLDHLFHPNMVYII